MAVCLWTPESQGEVRPFPAPGRVCWLSTVIRPAPVSLRQHVGLTCGIAGKVARGPRSAYDESTPIIKTSVSALMGRPSSTSRAATFGHVREFAVAPAVDTRPRPRYRPQTRLRQTRRPPVPGPSHPAPTHRRRHHAAPRAAPASRPFPDDDSFLLLERDLLDQQIIDVHGHKVVRVNDVDLVWENCARS